MRIVCIGDSLTYGFAVVNSKCWVSLFSKSINGEVLNKGINGDTTDGMEYRFKRDVINNKPTHVIIMGGSNDLIMERPLEGIISNIDSMVKLSIENNIVPIIGIQPPTDPKMANIFWSEYTDFNQVNREVKKYRDWVIGYGKNNKILYLDFYKAIEDSLEKYKKEEIFVDGVHFTARGHSIMASIIEL